MSYSFDINMYNSMGSFNSTKSYKELVKQNLTLLLRTYKCELYGDPYFGTNLAKLYHEPNDHRRQEHVEPPLVENAARQLPRPGRWRRGSGVCVVKPSFGELREPVPMATGEVSEPDILAGDKARRQSENRKDSASFPKI